MRFLFTCWGSLGDLHPYIAVGEELQRLGHDVTIAAPDVHAEKVQQEGLSYRSLPPHLDESVHGPELMAKVMDPKDGTRFLLEEVVMPGARAQWEVTREYLKSHDVMVAHPVTYGAVAAAEQARVPWVGVALQPLMFLSPHDPSVLPVVPELTARWRPGPTAARWIYRLGRRISLRMAEPVQILRRELGLPIHRHPIFDGQISPRLNLALFSAHFAASQPDWPANTVQTGFPFHDRPSSQMSTPAGLAEFLDDGEPPLVFTLGSAAVMNGGNFYLEADRIAAQLQRRAVMLVGRDGWNSLPAPRPEVHFCEYAPHSQVFPRAAAIIHQGGVGTTAQALRAGRPMLVAPHGHDQFDNGYRCQRLGVGEVLRSDRFTAERATPLLRKLLEDTQVSIRAAALGHQIAAETGAAAAASALAALEQ